ncbi:MAG: sugar phosphate isomerase/epimerase [Lentisphaerales bacterium]|nr:sugar phosphate isomerase/epimerase [Lentisphaerales bacterium]
MKTSIGSWAYTIGPYGDKPVDFDTVCEKLSKLGFDAVELGSFAPHPNPDDLDTKEKRQDAVEKLKTYGLEFSGIAANLWGEQLINTNDTSKYIAEFERNCEFSVDMGIKTERVDTVQGPTIFKDENIDQDKAMQQVIDTWKQCADIAAQYDLKVTWEGEPGFAFNKPSEIVKILEAMKEKSNFGYLYDTCHAQMIAVVGARQEGEKEVFDNQLEFLKLVGPYINHVHLIDSDNTCHKDENGEDETSSHPPFGLGVLDFDKVVPAIMGYHSYDNYWTVDLCFWDKAWEATEVCAKFMAETKEKYATASV